MPSLYKKITAVSLVGILLVLSGCSNQAPDVSFKTQDFSYDFEWNNQLETSYARQDSYDELTYGGPFYFGSFKGLDPFTQTYSEARAQKVKSMISVMDVTIDQLVTLENEVKNMRNIFDWYTLGIVGMDPDIKETMFLFLDGVTAPALENNLKLAYLKNLRDTLDENPINPEWGLLQYDKYAGIVDTYRSYTQEIERFYAHFLFLSQLLERDENHAYATHNADLDFQFHPVSERIAETLAQINYNIASLSYEEQLLKTTDYYFAQKMVAFLDTEFEKLSQSLNEYDGSKPQVDDDVIAFMYENLEDIETLKLHIQMKMDAVPEDELLPLELFADEEEIALIKTAHAFSPMTMFDNALNSAVKYASENPIVQKGVKTFKAVTKPIKQVAQAGADMTWKGIKKVGREAYAATKDVGQMVGVGLDTANAVVKSVVDVSQEVYYSQNLSWRDTFINSLESIDRNVKEVHNNYLLAKSGGAIFDEAEAVLNDVEEMAEFLVDETAKDTNTQGMISTGIGMTAKMSVGFFTGFAKDVYTVLNPNKDEADTAIAMTGLALTATGGSQSVGTASQVVSKTAQKSASYTRGLQKVISSNPQKIKNTIQIVKERMKAVATHPGEHMKHAFNNFLIDAKSGYKATRNNFTKNVSESFKGMFEKFSNTSNGVMDAMDTVLGTTSKSNTLKDDFLNFSVKIFDSYNGDKIDNGIKNMVGSFVADVALAETNNPNMTAEKKEELIKITQQIVEETQKDLPQRKRAKPTPPPAPKTPQQTNEELTDDIDSLLNDIDSMMSETMGEDWESVKREREERERKEAEARRIQEALQRIQREEEQAAQRAWEQEQAVQRAWEQEQRNIQPSSPATDDRHDWFDTETGLPKANSQPSNPTPIESDFYYEEPTDPIPYDDTFDEEFEDNFGAWPEDDDMTGDENFDFLGEIPEEDDMSGNEYFDEVLEEAPAPQGGGNNFFHGIDMSQEMSTGSGN